MASTLGSRVKHLLPQGHTLPDEMWRARHRALLALLWVNAVGLPIFALAQRNDAVHALAHGAVPASMAIAAMLMKQHRRLAAALVSLGLVTSAALLVHVWHGVIEAHFYFFVLIVVLALYEDWVPFLLAAAYVVLHHGLTGVLDPSGVYNHPDAVAHPWKWAAIHGGFVAAAGFGSVATWRLNEDVRAETRRAYEALEHEARHDALTGLPNRRSLIADLQAGLAAATRDRPLLLVLFDLDGFKAYNDAYGHPAGDALLTRLGHKLAQEISELGTAYRMGGDEFCVLASAEGDCAAGISDRAAAALSERGEGFSITASFGSVLMPTDTDRLETALRIADQRMYARKSIGSRASAGRQTTDALVRVLAERSPSLGLHLGEVAQLSRRVGERLMLAEDEVAAVLQAAALHDIGKAAIPDEILDKPDSLTEAEWEFMRRHPVIGERIMGVAPALTHAAKLVRSSHERFDGRGYPDGLAGESIPLGARIVFVCDAYDAMTSNRPYRAAMSPEGARAELHRCSGTQFDPLVVDAFLAVISTAGDDGARSIAEPLYWHGAVA